MSPLGFGLGSSRAFGIGKASAALSYWLQTLNYYPVGSQSDGYFIADVAKDASGNIYVLGNSRSDRSLSSHCLITKFNSIGELQWRVRVPENASTIRHLGNDIHVTSDGATIYVVGETYNAAATGTSFDTLVIKITTSNISPPGQFGISQFPVETYRMYLTDSNLPSPDDIQENYIRSVVDSSGNIYITCWYYTGYGVLTKCSISSNTLNVAWSKKITTSTGAAAIPSAIELDSSGNVYWVGFNGNDDNPIILKHNQANGDLIWCKKIQNTDYYLTIQPYDIDGVLGSIHIDANDNIYICGYSGRLSTDNTGILLAKLNTSGSLAWQRILQSPTFNPSEVFGSLTLTTDTSNNVYVAGHYSTGPGYIIFAKFNPANGNDLFLRSFGTLNPMRNSSRSLIVDSNSLIFANMVGAEQRAALLSKLPSDGSKTGTYTVQIDDINYATSPPLNYSITYNTFSAATNSDVTSTTTVSDFSVTLTNATQTTSIISETGLNGEILELYKISITPPSPSPAIVTDGLKANFRGDVYSGSGNWIDQTANGYQAVRTGTTYNSSPGDFSFNGTSDFMQISNVTPALNRISRTIEFWVYLPSPINNFGKIISSVPSSAPSFAPPYFSVGFNDTNNFYIGSGPNNTETTASFNQTNQWVHIVVTISGGDGSSPTFNFYVNGTLFQQVFDATGGGAYLFTDTDVWFFGAFGWSGSSTESPINCRIGEVRFYDNALISTGVTQNFNATKARYGVI